MNEKKEIKQKQTDQDIRRFGLYSTSTIDTLFILACTS